MPVRSTILKPHGLSFREAATLPLAAQTALQIVRRSGLGGFQPRPRKRRCRRSRFIRRSARKSDRRLRGGNHVTEELQVRRELLGTLAIDYAGDLRDATRTIAPHGFDVILDLVGGPALDDALTVIAGNGQGHQSPIIVPVTSSAANSSGCARARPTCRP